MDNRTARAAAIAHSLRTTGHAVESPISTIPMPEVEVLIALGDDAEKLDVRFRRVWANGVAHYYACTAEWMRETEWKTRLCDG